MAKENITMTYPLPADAENVGIMVATGLVGTPPLEFVFDRALTFPATSAEDVVIGTLGNPVSGETLTLNPADGRVKWAGSVLKVGATATATARTLYYVLTRTKGDSTFSQTVTVAAV